MKYQKASDISIQKTGAGKVFQTLELPRGKKRKRPSAASGNILVKNFPFCTMQRADYQLWFWITGIKEKKQKSKLG